MATKRAKRLPISAGKKIAADYGYDQVIVLAWDRETNTTSVMTYGKTLVDCEQAAQGGNNIKRTILRWPEEECNTKPARLKRKENG